MCPTKKDACIAALCYVLMGLPAPFTLIYIPRTLIMRGDAAATVKNILAHEMLFRGDFLAALDKRQLEAVGMLFLGLHHPGLVVNQIFWGLWLLPFGVLVMRSGFLPRILGVLLIVNCFAYVAVSLTSLLLPSYANLVSRAVLLALLGEVWIWLWLLIKGVKVQPLPAPAP